VTQKRLEKNQIVSHSGTYQQNLITQVTPIVFLPLLDIDLFRIFTFLLTHSLHTRCKTKLDYVQN